MVLTKPFAYILFLGSNTLDSLKVLEPLDESNPMSEKVSGKQVSLVPGLRWHIPTHCLEFSICPSMRQRWRESLRFLLQLTKPRLIHELSINFMQSWNFRTSNYIYIFLLWCSMRSLERVNVDFYLFFMCSIFDLNNLIATIYIIEELKEFDREDVEIATVL